MEVLLCYHNVNGTVSGDGHGGGLEGGGSINYNHLIYFVCLAVIRAVMVNMKKIMRILY